MTERKNSIKALWLCSWFPDKAQEQNGDFIERHAIAASLFSGIDVFHVVPVPTTLLDGKKIEQTVVRKHLSLSYHTALYRKKNNQLQNRLYAVWQYFSQYKKLINTHIAVQGLPDIVHVHIALRDGLVALWLKNKYNIPYVLTEHWTLYHKDNGNAFKQKSLLFKYLVKKILKNAAIVLPVSNHLGNTLQQIVPAIQYRTIPNVVNTESFQYKELSTQEDFIFIHVSSLIDLKNPKGIIEAFENVHRQYPFTQLLLIGEIKNLQTKVSNAGITLIDTIPNEDVAAYLQKSQVFVLFSETENQPCVLLESFCCGLPVISTAVGGVPEVVTEKNGILIEPGNVQMLMDKMIYMIQNYHQYDRRSISENAIAQYNYKKIGADINDVYSDIIQNQKQKTTSHPEGNYVSNIL